MEIPKEILANQTEQKRNTDLIEARKEVAEIAIIPNGLINTLESDVYFLTVEEMDEDTSIEVVNTKLKEEYSKSIEKARIALEKLRLFEAEKMGLH
jgi:hypothetical protein